MPAGEGTDIMRRASCVVADLSWPLNAGEGNVFAHLTRHSANSGQIFLTQSGHVVVCLLQPPVGAADISIAIPFLLEAGSGALAEAIGTDTVVPSMASMPRIQKQ